jgi:hypothetical protein
VSIFYRCAKHNPPEPIDFATWAELGQTPRADLPAGIARRYYGLSVWDNRSAALRVAGTWMQRKTPPAVILLLVLEIPEGLAFQDDPDNPHHYTVYNTHVDERLAWIVRHEVIKEQ